MLFEQISKKARGNKSENERNKYKKLEILSTISG
jgi:hypothetical protein